MTTTTLLKTKKDKQFKHKKHTQLSEHCTKNITDNVTYITKGKLLDLLLNTLKNLQHTFIFKFGPQKKHIANAIVYIQAQQKHTHDFDTIIKSKEQIEIELQKIKPELAHYSKNIHNIVTNNGYKLD